MDSFLAYQPSVSESPTITCAYVPLLTIGSAPVTQEVKFGDNCITNCV